MGAVFSEGSRRRFLRRKFVPPQLPVPYVPERCLTSQILDVASWRVCLMSIAAGYGKTSILRQWYDELEEASREVLWITLDAGDAEAGRFLEGVCQAFCAANPAFAALGDELGSAQESHVEVDDMCAAVVNTTDEFCDPETVYVLIFDDYDEACSPGLDHCLQFLNRFAGDNFRFVIAGRCLSARLGDMALGSSTLEFKTKDIQLYGDRREQFAQAFLPAAGGELGEGQLEVMRSLCGAWPTSYVFMHLAIKRAEGGDYLKELRGYCQRFFAQQVMSRVNALTYEFLLETAFLEELYPDLCDCVFGGHQSRAMLEQLCAGNFFIRYDAESGAYLHQSMFRWYLQDRMLCLNPGYIGKLAGRASGWYAENGMSHARAKTLALTVDPFYIEGAICGSVGMQRSDASAGFMEYLMSQPAARFGRDIYLVWVSIWSYIASGLVSDARIWIDLARRKVGEGCDQRVFDYANAICLALEGNSADSLDIIRTILADDDLPRSFQCLLLHMEGEDVERLGDVRGGRDLYLKAISLAERADGAFYKLFDYYLLAHSHLSLGSFEDALELIEKALASCQEGSSLWGQFNAMLAFVEVERGNVDAASTLLRRAGHSVSVNSNVDMYVYVHLVRAQYEHARGNTIEAIQVLSGVREAMAGKLVPRRLDTEVYAYQATYALEVGDMSLVRIAAAKLDELEGSSDVLRNMPCTLARARVRWAMGDRDEAFSLVSWCRSQAQQCGSAYYAAFSHVVETRFRFEAQERSSAMVSLGKAVELAMRGGYRSMFLDGGDAVRELLFEMVAGRKMSFALRRYAMNILLAFGGEDEISNDIALREGDVQGYYALTEREREILHLLNSGMSRRELSEALGVSQNTVKSHLKNIYAKLGVHTRSEALKATRESEEEKAAL